MRLYKTYEKIAIYAYPHQLLGLIKQHKEEIASIFEPYSDTHRHVVEVHLIADLGVYYGERHALITYNVYEERGGNL